MKRLLSVVLLFSVGFTIGCVNETDEPDPVTSSASYLVATTSDFMTNGNLALIATSDFSSSTDLLSLHSDNVVVTHGGSSYILERDGADNLLRVDGSGFSQSTVVYQKKIGTAVNIQDIGIVSETKAYITQYGSTDIAIVDPSTGDMTGTVALDDGRYICDGETVPYMADIIVVGDKAYVAIQRLVTVQGAYGPYPDVGDSTGLLITVSTATDEIVGEVVLTKSNPASMDTIGGYLYVSSSGSWSDATDGGIERIDPATGANEGVVVDESEFGGNISTLCAVAGSAAYVCVGKTDAELNFWTDVVECNLESGTVGDAVEGLDDAFGGLASDGEYLYVGDRGLSNPGVVVIDPSDNSTVAGPIDVGSLPPACLAVLTVEE